MSLFVATVLVCNLAFNTCNLHQGATVYNSIEACEPELAAAVDWEKRRLPMLGEETYKDFALLAFCAEPVYGQK